MVAQRIGELLELIGERMRLDQRHALDRVRRLAFGDRNRLRARRATTRPLRPTRSSECRSRAGACSREKSSLKASSARSNSDAEVDAGIDAGLREVQAAHARPEHGRALLDRRPRVAALGVDVRELAVIRGDRVVDALERVLEGVRHRVFEVDHHAGRARVEHFHDQLGVVRRTGHLIALVQTPGRAPRPATRRWRARAAGSRGTFCSRART